MCFQSANESDYWPATAAKRLLNFTRVLRFRWEKSTPDDPQGGDNRHGKVDTHDSPDRASNHYCEDGQQRMDLQFVAHDAWGNPVVHRYPPQAKQRGHPNPVSVHYEPNRGNDSQRRNPAGDGNKFQQPGHKPQSERVAVAQEQHRDGTISQRQHSKDDLGPDVRRSMLFRSAAKARASP